MSNSRDAAERQLLPVWRPSFSFKARLKGLSWINSWTVVPLIIQSVALLFRLHRHVATSTSPWTSSYVFAVRSAVAGRTVVRSSGALAPLAVSGRVFGSFFGGEGGGGSQRTNSCRSTLTRSGHSIITMWLPSATTFRKPIRRVWQD